MLWYLLLGKKNVVGTLFKRQAEHRATYEFVMKSFIDKKERAAASKNAFSLLSQKRYELSAAFFVLGNYLSVLITI